MIPFKIFLMSLFKDVLNGCLSLVFIFMFASLNKNKPGGLCSQSSRLVLWLSVDLCARWADNSLVVGPICLGRVYIQSVLFLHERVGAY